jgi:hypothetical protein
VYAQLVPRNGVLSTMSPATSPFTRFRAVATAIALSAVAAGAAAPLAGAEAGIGDPHAVNLRVSLLSTKLSSSTALRTRAWSEADGTISTPFAGTVSFGVSSAAARRDPVVVKTIVGLAGAAKRVDVQLSARQRSALRAAAVSAHSKTIAVVVNAIGQAPDRAQASVARQAFRLRVR